MSRVQAQLLALSVLLVACKGSAKSENDSGSYRGDYDYGDGSDGSDGTDGADGSDGGWADTGFDDGYGSEDELSERVLRPASTPRYVFVANADRDTVTRVSVPSLAVETVAVGVRPGSVVTTPDASMAVVLNVGSHSVSLLDTETLAGTEVEIRPHLNTLAVDPTGAYGAIWFSEGAVDDADPEPEGAQSYNEVSLVDLAGGQHHPLVVGFDPRGVSFTQDGTLAVIVSDAWLALVDLTTSPPTMERVRIAEDTADPPVAEELLLTPDGRYAFIRQYGVNKLKLVDLAERTVVDLPVGANPTDLDISPDGRTAIAVARTASELWLYDTEAPLSTPRVVDMPAEEVFGSIAVSPDGSQAILYSTAAGRARYGAWALADEDPGTVTVRPLVKPVTAVFLSEDGGTATFFHDKSDEGADPGSPFRYQWALTLVELRSHFANPILLAAEPTEMVGSEDGLRGYFIMDEKPWLEVLHFDTLLFDEVVLRSNASHLGILPGTDTAYVSQDHELGRISFYDSATGDLRTITGFELNAGIEY